MHITYDPEGNVLYIELKSSEPANSIDREEGVTADLNRDGHIIGLEILDARECLGDQSLTCISYEQLVPQNDSQPSRTSSEEAVKPPS